MSDKKRILLCDDDPSMLEFMVAQLASERISCTTTTRGREAVDKILNDPFDLLVLDACLPDLNGARVTQAIRERHPAAVRPILVVSAFFRRNRDQMDLLRGWNVQGFMTKPLLGPLFRKEVFRILEIQDETARAEPQILHLRDRFLQDLDATIEKIRGPFASGEIPFPVDDFLQTLMAQAHRIRGTAGSYGFSKISELAGEIEKAVEPCASRGCKITLPEWERVERLVDLMHRESVKALTAGQKQIDVGKGSILYLGDDDVFCRSLGKASADRGRAVTNIRSESDVIRLARAHKFDLLIVDMDFRHASAADVIRTMRSLAGIRPIPVICVGVKDDTATRVLAGRSGADMYHAKDTPLDELFEAVETVQAEQKKDSKLIVAVDDDGFQLMFLKKMLTDSEWTVKTIKGPEQALTAIRTLQPQIVLLDLEMPGLKGHDLCRALRTDAKLRNIPVVMLSANDDPAVRFRCLQMGALDFIVKGTEIPEIKTRLRNLLIATSRTAETEAVPHTLEARAAS
jgi:DNA-binding response OmpR family regulator